jgi:DNA polymerase I-like protein with 3'-5' exonuclease and polymerase domains
MNYIITKNPKYYSFSKLKFKILTDMSVLKDLPHKIGFDTETTGLDPRNDTIFCFQIGTGKDNYIVDLYTSGDKSFTLKEGWEYLKDKTLVMQNALFDCGMMIKHSFIPYKILDTMLATKILYNGQFRNQRADFKSIMLRELDITYDKTSQKNIHLVKLSQDTAIQYSFNDVDKIIQCEEVLFSKIQNNKQEGTYFLHCRFIKALAYMEYCGLPINIDMWKSKMKVDEKNVSKYKKEIGEYIFNNLPKYGTSQLNIFEDFKKDTTINLKSPIQMVKVFNDLGINTKDKNEKDSINESIISKSDHEFVSLWLKYQGAQHRVSTFGQSILDEIDIKNNRVYTRFNPMVDTARLSSRRGGINFLNFPADKETRSCFEAKPGNKIIVCDWSGQETVISADLSNDEAMMKSVKEGADLHCMLAREIFPEIENLSDKEIVKLHSDKRKFAKAPRFAMQYGGNDYTLHVNENIPLSEASEIYEKFLSLHQGLFDWGKKNLEKAIKLGYISSAWGWRMYLPKYDWFKDLHQKVTSITKTEWTKYRIGKAERRREYDIMDFNKNNPDKEPKVFIVINEEEYTFYKSKRKTVSDYFSFRSNYQRLALNNPVQTTGAHQMKLALSLMFEYIVENDLLHTVLMCNAVHDETVLESPESLANQISDKLASVMRQAGDAFLSELNIKADANIGISWYEGK